MNTSETLIRLALSFIIILGSLGLYLLYNWTLARRASRGLVTDLGVHHPGNFLIIYFSTPACAPCKTIQRPALEALLDIMEGGVQVLEIDASRQPEIADRWGVLSAPTTYVIDPRGRIKHINHGITRAEKLLMQLHS
jgi:thiol-disulfide isomerase/thioredoxin